jgi:hypothetical protein
MRFGYGCQRRRRPRLPAELAGVCGQVAQDDFLTADGGGFKVAAVKELLDGFPDDRAVGVAFPCRVPGELAQHPFGEVVPVPAGVAGGDQRADQAGQRRGAHERAPCPESRTSSTSRAQRRRCSTSSRR